jgi:hypothetical protein
MKNTASITVPASTRRAGVERVSLGIIGILLGFARLKVEFGQRKGIGEVGRNLMFNQPSGGNGSPRGSRNYRPEGMVRHVPYTQLEVNPSMGFRLVMARLKSIKPVWGEVWECGKGNL